MYTIRVHFSNRKIQVCLKIPLKAQRYDNYKFLKTRIVYFFLEIEIFMIKIMSRFKVSYNVV